MSIAGDLLKPTAPEPNIYCINDYPGNRFGIRERISVAWHPSFRQYQYSDCSFTALESWFKQYPHLFTFTDSIFPPTAPAQTEVKEKMDDFSDNPAIGDDGLKQLLWDCWCGAWKPEKDENEFLCRWKFEDWHKDRFPNSQPSPHEDSIHVQLPSGAIASVSPDASPELLGALDKMAELAMKTPDEDNTYVAIPEEISQWMVNWLSKQKFDQLGQSQWCAVSMIAMYRKMQEEMRQVIENAVAFSRLAVKHRNEIEALKAEREGLITGVEGWEDKYHQAQAHLKAANAQIESLIALVQLRPISLWLI